MSEPTEDRWADARRVLARRTPESLCVVNRYGAAILGPGGRTVCGLLLTGLGTMDDHADNLDALSLGWNVLPDLLAERDRYRAALRTIQQWDCLNPPDPTLLSDLPWLRSVVDDALAGGEGDADPVALTAAPLTPEEAASLDAWYGRATPHPAGETPVQREGDGDAD